MPNHFPEKTALRRRFPTPYPGPRPEPTKPEKLYLMRTIWRNMAFGAEFAGLPRDDRPRQRQRVGTDPASSASTGGHMAPLKPDDAPTARRPGPIGAWCRPPARSARHRPGQQRQRLGMLRARSAPVVLLQPGGRTQLPAGADRRHCGPLQGVQLRPPAAPGGRRSAGLASTSARPRGTAAARRMHPAHRPARSEPLRAAGASSARASACSGPGQPARLCHFSPTGRPSVDF